MRSNKTYTLVRCRFIIDSESITENLNLIVQGNTIKSIGHEIEGDEIDCSKYVVIPGLINAHTHSGMMIFRGYYDDSELTEWLSRIWDEERKMTQEVMNIGSELSIIEMLSKGITGFVDMYFNPEGVKELAEKYGIRIDAGYTFLDSMLDPYEVDSRQRKLSKSNYFKPIVNVHSIYSTSINTLKLAKQLAEETETRIHIHVAETRNEIFQSKKKYGKFPVEFLHELNIVEISQLVHLGWVANWELQYIKMATHCPTSNMKLATAGFFPFIDMIEKGKNVTIGTDGPSTNNSLDMFREMKSAVLLQRHSYWDTRMKALHALKSATEEGYKLMGIKGGKIKEGYVADLVLLDTDELYPLKKDRIVSNIVYNAVGENVSKVIIDGKVVYERGKFSTRKKELLSLIDDIVM
ncbi:N-ethylammeline chlorohydrolase [Sulfolobus acidocaldarius SUSAZ]|nr:N-ethylammeline chlorohydrolase [Sulfolobus acidocaldarius SUSAZ]